MEKCRNSFINVDIIGFLSPFSFSYFLFGTWICECALTINHRSKLISIFVAFMNVRQLHLLGVGWGKVGKVGRAGRGWAQRHRWNTNEVSFSCKLVFLFAFSATVCVCVSICIWLHIKLSKRGSQVKAKRKSTTSTPVAVGSWVLTSWQADEPASPPPGHFDSLRRRLLRLAPVLFNKLLFPMGQTF